MGTGPLFVISTNRFVEYLNQNNQYTNNTIENVGRAGIALTYETNSQISGNSIRGVNNQTSTANAAGITYGHVHLNVADLEVHKKLFVDTFGGTFVQKGPLATIKFPNMLVALTQLAPTGPSQGTVMDHFGFKVKDIKAMVETLVAHGRELVGRQAGQIERRPAAAQGDFAAGRAALDRHPRAFGQLAHDVVQGVRGRCRGARRIPRRR